MSAKVAVVGAGSWGTTVAHICAHNAPTFLYSRRRDVAAAINATHRNPRYLPDLDLHPEIQASTVLADVVESADVVVMGVPSHGFRAMVRSASPHLPAGVPVVSLAKGLERDTNLRMTQIINQELPGRPAGVLTGPNLAKEILAGNAAATVVAFSDDHIARELQRIFAQELFRVYTNPDVVGCEVGGALKNVMAIASGMADGLGTGDNTRAAVITRGLAELSRLGVAMGGQLVTFAGLAGMGDLIATCISRQSRNRYVGEELGKGRTTEQIVSEMKMVAEGIKTSRVAVEVAERYGVEMPIAQAVYGVVHEGCPATEAYRGLLRRDQQSELHGMG
jgi:glycerol-3-phosphate dehydrogenase (NAD(P)+)